MRDGTQGSDARTEVERSEFAVSFGSDADLRARLLAGAHVGRFRIVEQLGEGGMGLIFAGHDDELDRPVALKILRARQNDGPSRAKLLREAQALAKLSHPNVVTVYEVGEWEGHVFAAMELIAGRTLRDWLRETKPDQRAILDVLIQAGRGLAAAHAAGIVHRDFKPANVLVGDDGRTRVLDFGLAVAHGERDPGAGSKVEPEPGVPVWRGREPTSTNLLAETLTVEGAISGTPAYMAPEQLRGRVADQRSDVHAFGVTLFESLYGRRPFTGRTFEERLDGLGRTSTIDFSGGVRVSAKLRRLLARCMAVDPSARYPSMDALLDELERRPSWARAYMLAGSVVLVLLVGGGYGYGVAGHSEPLADPCRAIVGELEGLWSEDRRAQVEAGLDATELGYASAIWTRLGPELDAYASELAVGRVAACQAHARGEQDNEQLATELECLDRRALAFDALLEGLVVASPRMVELAIPAFTQLASPGSCRAAEPEPGSPVEPDMREQFDRLRDALEIARVANSLGRVDVGLAASSSVVTRTRELGWHALEAEALLVHGRLLVGAGELDRATETLTRGLWRADVVGDDLVLADAMATLGQIGGERGEDEAVLRWRPHADAVIERLGPGSERELELLLTFSSASSRVGQHDQAILLARRALALAESLYDEHDFRRARAYERLADALVASAELDQATPLYERALATYELGFGPEHPWIATTLQGLARVAAQEFGPDRALELYERAISMAELTRSPATASLVELYAETGELLVALARPAEARGLLEHACGLGKSILEPEHAVTLRSCLSRDQVVEGFAVPEPAPTPVKPVDKQLFGGKKKPKKPAKKKLFGGKKKPKAARPNSTKTIN